MSLVKLYPRKPSVDKTKTFVSVQDLPQPAVYASHDHIAYLAKRGLKLDQLVRTYCVYVTRRGFCFILAGGLGYQERVVLRDWTGSRFLYPKGIKMNELYYFPGHTVQSNELWLVEGTTDALALAVLGLRAASTMGSNVPPERYKHFSGLIRDPKRVYYIPDQDQAGHEASNRLIAAGIPARVLLLPPGKKDVCDLTEEERRVFIETCIKRQL